jgi:hypothetical protein
LFISALTQQSKGLRKKAGAEEGNETNTKTEDTARQLFVKYKHLLQY